MRTARRTLVLGAVTAVFVAAFAVPAFAGPAGQFISKINSSRAAAGLSPVESYWDLTDDAVAHTNLMADRGEIFHSSSLASSTSVWEKLGENVGVGLDVSSLHTAFMNSSGHRANILGDYNYVGVGVKQTSDGFMWVTVIFMKAAPGLNGGATTTTTTTPPATITTTTPPATTTTTTPAPAANQGTSQPRTAESSSSDKPSKVQEFGTAISTSEFSDSEQLERDFPVFGKPLRPAMIS